MRVTRKALIADNTELAAKLAVHNHATRKSQNEMIRLTLERNAYLLAEMKKRDDRIANLTADLALAKAAAVESAPA